jgi:hypothetical protein
LEPAGGRSTEVSAAWARAEKVMSAAIMSVRKTVFIVGKETFRQHSV